MSELEQEVIADVRMKQVERETLEKLSERKKKVISYSLDLGPDRKASNQELKYQSPLPPTNVSARELLGLPERFTGAELRRAWLRLVRELHPDRWATSP